MLIVVEILRKFIIKLLTNFEYIVIIILLMEVK